MQQPLRGVTELTAEELAQKLSNTEHWLAGAYKTINNQWRDLQRLGLRVHQLEKALKEVHDEFGDEFCDHPQGVCHDVFRNQGLQLQGPQPSDDQTRKATATPSSAE